MLIIYSEGILFWLPMTVVNMLASTPHTDTVLYPQSEDTSHLMNIVFQAVIFSFLFQAVIDANIFPVLIDILGKAEFKTRKEAAWAITNATSGGTAEQIRYLVDQGCIPPLCDLLTVMDGKIVQVALNGLENILRLGDQDARAHKGVNPYAVLIEECYGKLEKCILRP